MYEYDHGRDRNDGCRNAAVKSGIGSSGGSRLPYKRLYESYDDDIRGANNMGAAGTGGGSKV